MRISIHISISISIRFVLVLVFVLELILLDYRCHKVEYKKVQYNVVQ